MSCAPTARLCTGALPTLWGFIFPKLITLIVNNNQLYVTAPAVAEVRPAASEQRHAPAVLALHHRAALPGAAPFQPLAPAL